MIDEILNNHEDLSIEDINKYIEKLNDLKFQKSIEFFKEHALKKITLVQYNDFKQKIRKFKNTEIDITIPKTIKISVEMGDVWGKPRELYFDTYEYSPDSDEQIIEKNEQIKKIKTDITNDLKSIKDEISDSGMDPNIFILKIINEIQQDEDNIKDIIE